MIQDIVDHVEASQQDTPVGRKVLKEQTKREEQQICEHSSEQNLIVGEVSNF